MAADIDVRTAGLHEFAGNGSVDLDHSSLKGMAGAATQGNSMMTEGAAFFQAQRSSIQLALQHFDRIKQGMYGYRTGAENIANTYTATEEQVDQTVAWVPLISTTASSTGEGDSAPSDGTTDPR